jgi:hypothetical protein
MKRGIALGLLIAVGVAMIAVRSTSDRSGWERCMRRSTRVSSQRLVNRSSASRVGTQLDESNVRKVFNKILDKAELHRRGSAEVRRLGFQLGFQFELQGTRSVSVFPRSLTSASCRTGAVGAERVTVAG